LQGATGRFGLIFRLQGPLSGRDSWSLRGNAELRTLPNENNRPGADILMEGDTGEQCATELVEATYFNKYPRSA